MRMTQFEMQLRILQQEHYGYGMKPVRNKENEYFADKKKLANEMEWIREKSKRYKKRKMDASLSATKILKKHV